MGARFFFSTGSGARHEAKQVKVGRSKKEEEEDVLLLLFLLVSAVV